MIQPHISGDSNQIPVEVHPLQPFLPKKARLLMLGSFPPQRKRWSMDFFYPNIQNDMWRIFGLVFFGDKNYFYDPTARKFRLPLLKAFLTDKGIAIYDTATAIRRLQDNASDKFLDIVTPTDIRKLLSRIPTCRAIAATGQRAADVLSQQLDTPPLQIGKPVKVDSLPLTLYRMPSSSRSYPLALSKKADIYRKMFEQEQIITVTQTL